MRLLRPLARACIRFKVGPWFTKMADTFSISISNPALCSAFAMADPKTFLKTLAFFLTDMSKFFIAFSTVSPRIRFATNRVFCGDNRAYLKCAATSTFYTSLTIFFHLRLWLSYLPLYGYGKFE